VRAKALYGVFVKTDDTLIYLRRTYFFDTGGIPCLPQSYVHSHFMPLNKKAQYE
jgi:hypothetical protein